MIRPTTNCAGANINGSSILIRRLAGVSATSDEQVYHPSGNDQSFDLQEKITTDQQPMHHLVFQEIRDKFIIIE